MRFKHLGGKDKFKLLIRCRDNLKINVRESAEMDQADLELRATIMKVPHQEYFSSTVRRSIPHPTGEVD